MLTLEGSKEEKILEKRPGTIIGINKEFDVIEIELDADRSTSTVHKCWCTGFKPKLGDKVIEVITNYGWRVEKSPYSSVESEQVATNEKVGSSSLSRGKLSDLINLGIMKITSEKMIKDRFMVLSRHCPRRTYLGKCSINSTGNYIQVPQSLYFPCDMVFCPYMKGELKYQ